MKSHRPAVAALAAVIAVGCWVLVASGQQVPLPTHSPAAARTARASTTKPSSPAFEGWGPHKDGANVILHRLLQPQQRAGNRHPDWSRTIGSSRAARTTVSRRTSRPGAAIRRLRHSRCPRTSGTKKLTWTLDGERPDDGGHVLG